MVVVTSKPRRDTNFYYSFAALSPARRDAIVAVWDFMRAVDDAVDEAAGGPAEAAERVALWRAEVAAVFEGREPATPEGKTLAPHVAAFGLPRSGFDDVIDGVEMDVTPRRFESFEDLRQYCLRVASAVGLVCIEIFGYRNAACRQYAIDLGIALQLTNILRDLGKDLRAGRLYLPQEDLRACGVDESELRACVPSEAVMTLLRRHAARAREYFGRALRELPSEDTRSLVAARIMGVVYETLLDRIEMRGFDVFGEPVRLRRAHKAALALRTWAAAMAGF